MTGREDWPGDLRIRVTNLPGAPVVGMRVMVRGGARIEAIPGLCLVSGRLLGEGTVRRDWRELAEEAEIRGFSILAYGVSDHHGLAVESLRESFDLALERMIEILLEPRFDASRCDWIRQQAIAERRSLADQPDVLTGWGFLRQLYHPHPSGRPLHGVDESGLVSIEEADCASFHEQGLGSGLVVSVAGDVAEEVVEDRLRELLGRSAPLRTEQKPMLEPVGTSPRQEVELPPGDQAHLLMGRRTILRVDPDYVALQVLSVILGSGAGLTGRLPERVRESEGLAYSVHVGIAEGAGLDPGHLLIYVGTSPDTVGRAEVCVREELSRIRESGPSEKEIREAKDYLLGRQPFRRETSRQVADVLAAAAMYGDASDDPAWVEKEIRAVDRDCLLRLAERWLDPEELLTTVGLPAVG